MPTVIKVKANEAGQFPVRLFGEDYLIEPVKDKRSETKTANKRKASKPSPDEVGQPLNDTPEQDPNNTETDK